MPTWNYVAVHAYGTCRLVDDPGALADILARTVATYERPMPSPWAIDTGSEFFRKHVRVVVGFRVEVSRLEGKWKLNQNHPEERRQKVVRALEGSGSQAAREVARLIAQRHG